MPNNTYAGVKASTSTSSDAFVNKLNKRVLDNFYPNVSFSQFAEAPIDDSSADNIVWAKFPFRDLQPASAELMDGITSNEQSISPTSLSAKSKQYGIHVVLTDLLTDKALRNMSELSADRLWESMAIIIDRVYQDEVIDNATKKLFSATTAGGTRATTRAWMTDTTYHLFNYDIAVASSYLEGKNAPKHSGWAYVWIVHPFCAHFLKTETGAGGMLWIRQYTTAGQEMIYKGELWMIHGVRMIMSSNVKYYNSTVRVYPTVVLWKGAYWGTQLQGLRTIVKWFWTAGTEDPYDQRMTIAVKQSMACKILQQDAIIVIEWAGVVI